MGLENLSPTLTDFTASQYGPFDDEPKPAPQGDGPHAPSPQTGAESVPAEETAPAESPASEEAPAATPAPEAVPFSNDELQQLVLELEPPPPSFLVLHASGNWGALWGQSSDYPRFCFGGDAVIGAHFKDKDASAARLDGLPVPAAAFLGLDAGVHGLKEGPGRARDDATLYKIGPAVGVSSTQGTAAAYVSLQYAHLARYAPSNLRADTEVAHGVAAAATLKFSLLHLSGGVIAPVDADGVHTDELQGMFQVGAGF